MRRERVDKDGTEDGRDIKQHARVRDPKLGHRREGYTSEDGDDCCPSDFHDPNDS